MVVVVVVTVVLLWVVPVTLPITFLRARVVAGILVPLVVLRAVVLSSLVRRAVVGVASTVGVTVIGGTCMQINTHVTHVAMKLRKLMPAIHRYLGNGEQTADVQREPPLMRMKTSPRSQRVLSECQDRQAPQARRTSTVFVFLRRGAILVLGALELVNVDISRLNGWVAFGG